MLIDLDRFDEINSSIGEECGDRLLVEVGRRIAAVARPGDVVARTSGDEFALLRCTRASGTKLEQAGALARDLLDAVRIPLQLAGTRLPIEASIGVAIAPDHGSDVAALWSRAACALREAKKSRSGYRVFGDGCFLVSRASLERRADLHTSLGTGQIEVWYQPKTALRTGRVTGVEALVRWRHPVDGIRPPDEFLSEMDTAGLMPQLTELVLATALADCSRWRDGGAHLTVSVNVPASVIVDLGFVTRVRHALGAAGVPPSALCIEVTEEDSLMTRRDAAQEALSRLRALGVRVSLDDYGSGYCSLEYLRDLPADELKLDRAFLRNVESDPVAAEIVRSTVTLAHTLRLRMVVEGVETARSWALLAAWGCDEVQGYFVSPPIMADQVIPWLHQWARRTRPSRSAPAAGSVTLTLNRRCIRRGSTAPVASSTLG